MAIPQSSRRYLHHKQMPDTTLLLRAKEEKPIETEMKTMGLCGWDVKEKKIKGQDAVALVTVKIWIQNSNLS